MSGIKYNWNMDSKSISGAITSIGRRGKALEKQIHQVAVSCLAQIAQHGNTTQLRLLCDLVSNLPGSWRTNALIAWSEAFGSVDWDSESKDSLITGKKGTFAYNKKKKTDLEAAKETSPASFKGNEGGDYKPFELETAIQTLINRARKRVEKADKRDNIDMTLLQRLEVLGGKRNAADVTETPKANGKPDAKEKKEIEKTLKQAAG